MICLIFRCIFWKTGALFASRVGGASTGQLPMTSRGQSTKWNCFSPLTSSPTLRRADHKVAKQLAPPSPNSKFQHWFQLLQQPNPGIPNPWPSQSKRLSGMWQNPFPIQFLHLHTRWSFEPLPFMPRNSWANTFCQQAKGTLPVCFRGKIIQQNFEKMALKNKPENWIIWSYQRSSGILVMARFKNCNRTNPMGHKPHQGSANLFGFSLGACRAEPWPAKLTVCHQKKSQVPKMEVWKPV